MNPLTLLGSGLAVVAALVCCSRQTGIESHPVPFQAVKEVEIVSLHWLDESMVELDERKLLRRRNAVHVFLRNPVLIDSLAQHLRFTKPSAPQMLPFDVRTVALFKYSARDPDTLSFGPIAGMAVNRRRILFDTALAQRVLQQLPASYLRQMEETFAANR